jgi:hypothetical protein
VASTFLAPFSQTFPAGAIAEARGKPVLFPDRYIQAQEHYRFLLPGADVRGYPCSPGPEHCPGPESLAPGALAALLLDPGEALPAGWVEVASLPHLKQRHTPAQVRELLGGRLDLLLERLVLARAIGAAASK